MMAIPFKLLSAADLATSPIWQWATDAEEQGDLNVTPLDQLVVPREGPFHLAVDVQAANGMNYTGLVELFDGELTSDEVALVAISGGTWVLGAPPNGRKENAWFQETFGASYTELLPVSWRARALVEDESEFRAGQQGVA
jgi:hypothetical protein